MALQRQKRLDEVSALLDKKNPKNELVIAGIEVKATPRGSVGGSNKSGTTKVFDSRALTDAQIKDYAQQLTGGVPLEKVKDGVYAAKLSDATIVNLRSVSKSNDVTQARWTIDIRNNPSFMEAGNKKVELKFR
ncbi:hemagglutinin [Xylella fastidiosa subsp. fastidiosa]|nr:hemagglutinin [Xylella fastidiosa subsp. fastidiosa]